MTEKLRSNEGLATNLGIDAFGIRTSENRIKVQLRDCSQNCIDQFKAEVLDSPMLDFIPTQGPYDFLATTIQMGNRISSGGYSSSVGYRAKTSAGVSCFVSAGHGIQTIGQTVSYNNQTCATCIGTHIGETIDAAVCALSSGFEVSDITPTNSTKLNPEIQVLYQGWQAHMEGFKNGHRYGSVYGINESVKFKHNGREIILSGLTSVDLNEEAEDGDSGGVVYTDNNNIAGIVQSGKEGSNRMYYVKAGDINSYFNLELY